MFSISTSIIIMIETIMTAIIIVMNIKKYYSKENGNDECNIVYINIAAILIIIIIIAIVPIILMIINIMITIITIMKRTKRK